MSGVLAGLRVVVTRAAHQSGDLASLLVAQGARVVALPVLSIAPPPDSGEALHRAVARVHEFAWIVFTSANAVDAFVDALPGSVLSDGVPSGALSPGAAALEPATPRVAAIGPATAAALEHRGIAVVLRPGEAVGESLAAAFPRPEPGAPRRVLLPRALVARDVVPDGLAALGWEVEVVAAYETIRPPIGEDDLASAAEADVITFTSSSSVTGYLEVAGPNSVPPIVASIGPVTSATARAAGIRVDVEAAHHSAEGLVTALCAHLESRRRRVGPDATSTADEATPS